MSNGLKTFLFTLLFVMGVATVGIPYLILRNTNSFNVEQSPAYWPGLFLICAGAAIYGWCAWSFVVRGDGTPAWFDPPKRVVATGPYRFTRNPMYVGVLSVLAGESLLFASRGVAVYTAVFALCVHLRVVLYEEPTLRKQFGESYDSYCRRVHRWLPRVN